MVAFIDENRDDFGVEPICATLQVAPSTYYENKSRIASPRAIRDAVMMPVLLALFKANYSVYGVRKLWKAALRDGHTIGRDQVGRLMRQLDITWCVTSAAGSYYPPRRQSRPAPRPCRTGLRC